MVVININTHEYTFSVNEFGEPNVLEGSKAIATILARLLLLEPGTFQSHPTMGVGLVSKYRYTLDTDLYKLREDYTAQIEKYLPQYQGGVKVSTNLQNKVLYIAVKTDNTIYNFLYDFENDKFKSSFRMLSDL